MKRFLSMILALAMVIALVPAVFASGETGKAGIKVEYGTYVNGNGDVLSTGEKASAPSKLTSYVDKQGRLSYYNVVTSGNINAANYWDATLKNDSTNGGARFVAAHEITSSSNDYVAYKIRIPVAGDYEASLFYLACKNDAAARNCRMYILPIDAASNIVGALDNETLVFSDVNFYDETATQFKTTDKVDFTADKPGEYLMVWKNTGDTGVRITPAKLILDGGTGKAPIWTDAVNFADEDAVLDAGNNETTEITLGNVYMSDGNVATEAEKATITYASTNEAVASISGARVIAKTTGKTTIRAMVGEYVLGEKEIQVVNTKLSGITVEYGTYVNGNGDVLSTGEKASAPSKLTSYADKQGRLAYHNVVTSAGANVANYWDATLKNDSTNGGARFVAAHEITSNNSDYVAYKIRIPVAGDYEASLFYLACKNDAAARNCRMYILPIEAASNIVGALATATPVLSDVNFYDATATQFKTTDKVSFTVPSTGEYLMVWKNTGDTGVRITPAKLILDGGTGKTPIWVKDMALENAALLVGEKTDITSTVYMSDGVVATEEEAADVTYESTNNAVATVSGTTVTAEGAGTAKIQAKSGDYILGEVDVTVTAPKAPTVSFYAESTDNENTPITIAATDADGSPVVPANAATLNRGAEVTVVAPEKEGYLFVGWFRGSKENGRFVWADSEYSFNAMTHTMLTAVYEVAPEKAYYNFNGEFLGTSEPSTEPTMLGYNFDGWNETVYNNLTRCVAKYLKDKDTRYTVNLPTGVSVEKDEADYYYYYDTKVTLTSNTDVTWLRNGEPVAYGEEYTFYVWDDVEITTATTADTAPKVILDSSKSGAYMIEYDAGDKTIIEKGIIFGANADITIDSCEEKMNSQRSEAHGQFTASSNYTNARGYLIYADNGEYKVIYAD